MFLRKTGAVVDPSVQRPVVADQTTGIALGEFVPEGLLGVLEGLSVWIERSGRVLDIRGDHWYALQWFAIPCLLPDAVNADHVLGINRWQELFRGPPPKGKMAHVILLPRRPSGRG